MTTDVLFDVIVAAALPCIAWAVLRAQSMQRAIVLFIALGLLSSLAWSRLDAIDIALVEASIGAGLSGALFITTLPWSVAPPSASLTSPIHRAWCAAITIGIAGCLGIAALELSAPREGLTRDVLTNLDAAGVTQPVTAVLMNFRGYDTLLEITVLLAAGVAVRLLRARAERGARAQVPELLASLANLLFPVTIVLGGYLLWRGSHGPGGAFQAGAVLAGGVAMLMLADRMRVPILSRFGIRAALLLGPTFFVALAAAPLPSGGRLLEYPTEWAHFAIVALESALAISIGIVLAMFFPSMSMPSQAGGEP